MYLVFQSIEYPFELKINVPVANKLLPFQSYLSLLKKKIFWEKEVTHTYFFFSENLNSKIFNSSLHREAYLNLVLKWKFHEKKIYTSWEFWYGSEKERRLLFRSNPVCVNILNIFWIKRLKWMFYKSFLEVYYTKKKIIWTYII